MQEAYFHLLPEAKRLSVLFRHGVVATRTPLDYRVLVRAFAYAWIQHCGRLAIEKGYTDEALWVIANQLVQEGHLRFLYGKLPHANDNQFY